MPYILGYVNPRDAISKHVDAEDKGVSQIATTSGLQAMTVINESGLYGLILSFLILKKGQAAKYNKLPVIK